MSTELSIADILTRSAARKPSPIKTPEIAPDSVLYIYAPESDDRDLCELQWTNYKRDELDDGTVGFRKFLVAWCLANSANERLIQSGTEETRVSSEFVEKMNQLGKSLPMSVFNRCFDASMQKMGFSKTDQEDLEKNSVATGTVAGNGSKRKPKASAASSGSDNSKTPAK